MSRDVWHYPRRKLAKQVLDMFESGLSSALVFFAPRRMGKTEFLLKDMQPLAEDQGWHVLYFSFLDTVSDTKEAFTLALLSFAIEIGVATWGKFKKNIQKISAGAIGFQAGIEFRDPQQVKITLKELMDMLKKHPKKILLLLDEVQILARDESNREFVAALRTALDVNKDQVKVIFTGSSREGLRKMFSKSDAPFFHFGQNLPFPEFEEDFAEHLAKAYQKTTCRKIDKKVLWDVFVEMGKVPQLIRSLVERLVLQPDQTLQESKEQLLQNLTEDREYADIWEKTSILERLLIRAIAIGGNELFSVSSRAELAKQMGLADLPVTTVQSAIRTLQRKNIICSSPDRGVYYIDDPNFGRWINDSMSDNENT